MTPKISARAHWPCYCTSVLCGRTQAAFTRRFGRILQHVLRKFRRKKVKQQKKKATQCDDLARTSLTTFVAVMVSPVWQQKNAARREDGSQVPPRLRMKQLLQNKDG